MSKHTPGSVVKWQGFDADGYVVVEATGKAAAARTAAPALLAALEALLDASRHDDNTAEAFERVQAAERHAEAVIAQARGDNQ